LQQVIVDEVGVTDTARATVIQSVAHSTSAVVVADQIATDGVGFTLETPHATFIDVLTHQSTQ